MALSVVPVENCYLSSTFPNALFVPTVESYYNSKKNNLIRKSPSYIKSKKEILERNRIQNTCNEDGIHKTLTFHSSFVQTDIYLEEICNIVRVDVQCETEPFLDEELSTVFTPIKVGCDAETQVSPGELFDFEDKIQPVLDDIVEKTLKQSVQGFKTGENFLVLEEVMSNHTERINAKFRDIDALDDQERQYLEEKMRKLTEKEEAIKLENDVAEKIAAFTFSQQFLSKLIPDVYKKLEIKGYFQREDMDTKNLEDSSFWPWLINEVDNEIATLEASCNLLDTLMQDSNKVEDETTNTNKNDADQEDNANNDVNTSEDNNKDVET